MQKRLQLSHSRPSTSPHVQPAHPFLRAWLAARLQTATTVGYGDVVIRTQAGEALACVHILISVSLLAAVISDIDGLRQVRRQELRRGRQLVQRVNVEAILALDQEGNGVDKFEFVFGMLMRIDAVDPSDVASFAMLFEALNASGDGDGTLTRLELEGYAKHQAALYEASPQLQAASRQMRRALGGELQTSEANLPRSPTRRNSTTSRPIATSTTSRPITTSTTSRPITTTGRMTSSRGPRAAAAKLTVDIPDGERKCCTHCGSGAESTSTWSTPASPSAMGLAEPSNGVLHTPSGRRRESVKAGRPGIRPVKQTSQAACSMKLR